MGARHVCFHVWCKTGLSPRVRYTTMPKILVVDDLRDSADRLALLFDSLGRQTMTSCDGRQAGEAAQAFGPDIEFLDINMPILEGYGAARTLRRMLVDTAPVPVALTAGSGPDAERRADDADFDFYVTKPADFNMLVTVFDDLSRRLEDKRH
jgi:CheY-like chemotaxis protein